MSCHGYVNLELSIIFLFLALILIDIIICVNYSDAVWLKVEKVLWKNVFRVQLLMVRFLPW